MFLEQLTRLNAQIFDILSNEDLLKNKHDVFKLISKEFLDLGFQSFTGTMVNLQNEIVQVYPMDHQSSFSPFVEGTYQFRQIGNNTPFVVKKISVGQNQENALFLPFTVNDKLVGIIVLSGIDQVDKFDDLTYFFTEAAKSLAVLFKYMLKADGVFWKEMRSSMHQKLCLLNLNDRQAKVAELLLSGGTNKDIANAVNLSEQAIKYHVGNILAKFDCKNRHELKNKIKEKLS